jgi:putative ABC transport system permease protein
VTVLRLLRVWRLRLRSLLRQDTADTELHRELAFHVEQLVAEKMEAGLSAAEARDVAYRTFGNVAALEESCRDVRRVSWARDLQQDVVYGVRILRKRPGFTAVAALSLALGIGANAAVLGTFDALLVQTLQVPHADRLVAVQGMPLDNPSQLAGNTLADYAAFRDRGGSFELIAASIRWTSDVASDEPGARPDRIAGQLVTPAWLTLLGIEPEIGRVFSDTESRPNYPTPVIVISHQFWQRRFGADPDVLNRQLRVQGVTRTIVGVMPASFRYQEPGIDFWMPLHVGAAPDPGGRLFAIRARLKPGVSIARAQSELEATIVHSASQRAEASRGWGVRVRPLQEFLFGWARRPLLTLGAAVVLVWLIGCANVTALLLSRASVRAREVALRVALGAGRGRILRQLLTESVLLAAGGGVLGLIVALIGQRALLTMSTPPGSPALAGIGLNVRVSLLLGALTLVAGLACGLVPALRGSKLDPIGALREPDPGRALRRRHAFPQGVLVSSQLALALVLLIGTGLLLNSLIRQLGRDLGFDPGGLVRAEFGIPAAEYTRRTGAYRGFPYFDITPAASEAHTRVLERLRALPGAPAVGGISAPPVDSFILTRLDVILDDPEGSRAEAGPTGRNSAAYFLVTPHLFSTIRTPILRGREVSEHDTVSSPWVAVVNEACARRFWPGENPIGKVLTLDTVPEEQPREVVGVVGDIPTRHAQDPEPVIYASYLQQPSRYRGPWANLFGQMVFMIRPAGDPAAIMPAVRQAIAEVQPTRPLVMVTTAEWHLHAATAQFRSYVGLVSVFALTATVIAVIGTYGVMAYVVSLRTREIGIRRALGAGRRDIVVLVGRRALLFLIAGLAAGVAGALALTRLIEAQLWGITATDPATFAGVSMLLASMAVVAAAVPAYRALRVDPAIALRND